MDESKSSEIAFGPDDPSSQTEVGYSSYLSAYC